MATEYELTESWVEIYDGSGFMSASIQGRGQAIINDALVAPASDSLTGHQVSGGGSFTYGGSAKVYARLLDAASEATVTVTKTAGGGVTGLTALAFVSVVTGRS